MSGLYPNLENTTGLFTLRGGRCDQYGMPVYIGGGAMHGCGGGDIVKLRVFVRDTFAGMTPLSENIEFTT